MESRQIAVLGAGSWGTAIAKLLADQGHHVRLWARSHERADDMIAARENTRYLPGFELPPTLTPTGDLATALIDASMVVSVIPTHGLRAVLNEARPMIPNGVTIVSATKGIEEDTLMLVSDIFENVLPKTMHWQLTYLGGPSFAREVAMGIPTAVCIAGHDRDSVRDAQTTFTTERFRVYNTEDVVGVELGGALKNVIAIAAGVADGMGLGHNARAGLITRGLAETSRLAIAMGAHPLTLSGLAGMGDLVLTCTGDLSRNRQVGMDLGRGKTIDEILSSMNMVAEGVRTAKSLYNLCQARKVEMPISHEVYRILYEGKSPTKALTDLMSRPLRHERE